MSKNNTQNEFDVPSFCPSGCGRTLIASRGSEKELEIFRMQFPHTKVLWHIQCPKCGEKRWIGEF